MELSKDGLIGLLEIPRLGFSEIVVHGDDEDTLRVAVGHLPDTPLPWQQGNSAFAGHRDGRFRPLKDIRIGDRITLATRQGNLHYVLRHTKIVSPDDLSVLAPTDTRTLTLITCYPFSYVGKAPKRFILEAEAIEVRAAGRRPLLRPVAAP
jgi:LPXTG-site transpeptidase (sortase) family protein